MSRSGRDFRTSDKFEQFSRKQQERRTKLNTRYETDKDKDKNKGKGKGNRRAA